MAGMVMQGRYLGRQSGSFADKNTGEHITWARMYVWDDDTPQTVKPDKDYKTFDADTAGLVFGDFVRVECSITANASGMTVRATKIEKIK